TLRDSVTYRHWRAAPLSTMYPLTNSESSSEGYSSDLLASSSERSPTTSMPLPAHPSRAPSSVRADLLPPYKRFRSSSVVASPEDCTEEGELAVVEAGVGDDDEEDDGMEGDDQAGDESDAKVYVEADARAEPKENT
nr:hypothetical protein [Tanacetum cinerariifolium]